MKILKSILYISALYLITGLPAFGFNPLLMNIKISGMEQATPPEIIDQHILFSYKTEQPVRFVGARFEHEDYSILHPYSRNEYKVFILLYDIPKNEQTLKYRIVVDGLWMSDPTNPYYEKDILGTSFSCASLEGRPLPSICNPEYLDNGELAFTINTLPGRIISIIGDFNNWDPYMHKLQEEKPGYYRIKIKVLPGQHYYTFIVGGERMLDPYNIDSAVDYEDCAVSTFNTLRK